MKLGLRITGLVAWIHTAIILFLGGFVPLFIGLPMGAMDVFEFLTRGMDGNDLYPKLSGGGWLLLITAVAVISAAGVFIISIVNFFVSKKPLYGPSMGTLIANYVILSINALLQLLGGIWMNVQYIISDFPKILFFIGPIVEYVVLIGMTILFVFSIRNLKEEQSLKEFHTN